MEFTDILSTNGEMSFDELEGIRGYASLSGYWFSTDGYLNPVVCYDDVSTWYGDNYNVTSGDGFWQDSENWRGGRRIGFTLTYNFGNMGKRKPQAPNRPMGGEDGPGMFEMD